MRLPPTLDDRRRSRRGGIDPGAGGGDAVRREQPNGVSAGIGAIVQEMVVGKPHDARADRLKRFDRLWRPTEEERLVRDQRGRRPSA